MWVDDAVGAVAVHGWVGFIGVMLMGIFGGGTPTGALGNGDVDVTILGQLVGVAALFPLAFLSGYIVSGILKKANLLRVPPEVEVAGLDQAEFNMDFFPDHEMADEKIVLADGSTVPAGPVLREAYGQIVR